MRAQHRITVAKQDGRRVWTIAPRSGGSGKVLLYLHGGAYVRNLTLFHWMLIGELIGLSKATVVVPDHPLAPAASYRDTYAFVQRSYADRLMHHAPEQIIFMGDSAGGGLALGLA